MRKSLLSVVFLMLAYVGTVHAQETDLFEAPDSVCEKQAIQLISNFPDKQSHYWGFCSGYLYNTPTGLNIGDTFSLNGPSGLEVMKNDDGNYYGFAMNVTDKSFVRLNYGKSLENIPTTTSFGTMDDIFPTDPNAMYIVRDYSDSNWYMFITAGTNAGNASLSRIDFGKSLANTPNIVNFGNIGNMTAPFGIFISKVNDQWCGFFVNRDTTDDMYRFDIGKNISLTPTVVTKVIPSSASMFDQPSDIGAIQDNGKWYFFVLNAGDGTIVRMDMDSLMNVIPNTAYVTGTIPSLSVPSSISLVRDCGKIHAFISNLGSHDIIRMDMDDIMGPYTGVNFSAIGGALSPTSVSRVVRDRDNVYFFVPNQANNTISRIKFAQCTNTDIRYSLTNRPPEYRYTQAGFYNVYYAINEGLPDMQVQCKQITVLPTPALILLPPDTLICQGDTARIRIVSINAISYSWTPNYNLSSPDKAEIKVWPAYSTKYNVRMPFPLGTCIVDTNIMVNVVKIQADAGPNRTIADGASTTLGGPLTSTGPNYLRVWTPNQYIDDVYSDFPIARPPHDMTYYLTVSDTNRIAQCSVTDTVVVLVDCENLNMPNAFTPERSGSNNARFGLLNRQVAKLNTFIIYDRWGKKVFETDDPTNQWDGTIDGSKAAVGVYVWEVDGFCLSGKRINMRGNVMLIR